MRLLPVLLLAALLVHAQEGPPELPKKVLVLRSRPEAGARDAAILSRLLSGPSGEARVLKTGPREVHLLVDDVGQSREALSARIRRSELAFHTEAVDAGSIAPQPGESVPAGLRAVEKDDEAVYVAASAAALAPLAARAGRGQVVRTGCVTESKEVQCRAYLLERQPALTGAHVAHATVALGPEPEVQVRFTRAGSQRLSEVTDAAVGRRLVLIVDGQVQVAPRINEPITGGSVRLTLPRPPGDYGAWVRELATLATTLGASALRARWEVAEVRPAP
jgi:hypothetical protein